MKKTLIAALLLAGLGASAEVIRYDAGADLTTVDSVSVSTGWVIKLYQDVNNDNAGSWYNSLTMDTTGTITGGNDDILVTGAAGTTVADLSGVFGVAFFGPPTSGVTFQGTDSDSVSVGEYYGVLFNASSIAAATQFVVLDQTTTSVNAGDGTTGLPASYSVGLSGTGTWQAVPEPATVGLFGLGALSAWIIRRNKAKTVEA